MPDIRRFVTYLYYYENNHKMQIAGFAKIEIRGEQCRLELHINAPGYQGTAIPVYLFAREEENMHAVEIGTMTMNQKGGEYRTLIHGERIGHSPYGMNDMKGLLILVDEEKMYASQWEDGIVDRSKIQIYEAKMLEKTPQTEVQPIPEEVPVIDKPEEPELQPQPRGTDTKTPKPEAQPQPVQSDTQKSDTQTPQLNQQSEPQPASTPEIQATEVPMRKILTPAFDAGQSLWEYWELMKNKMTVIHPIEGEEISCVHMELRDIRELPRRYWYLGNNSFLLHGFFNYRYLLMGERAGDGGNELFLGIPGVYQSQEKVMASIFGFPLFITEKKSEAKEDRFGYWCHIMNE